MPKIVHFEIVTNELDKLRKFYESVFDWKFNRFADHDYWLISAGDEKEPGINGGFVKSKGKPVIVNTIDVDNLDNYIKKVNDNGGKIVVEKQAVPGVGWLCYFKDTEGNLFGMMQTDRNAV